MTLILKTGKKWSYKNADISSGAIGRAKGGGGGIA
jgi:hypothetical protein